LLFQLSRDATLFDSFTPPLFKVSLSTHTNFNLTLPFLCNAGNIALFPFFEETWIGWGWLTVWVQPIFWIAILVSLAVQLLESFTLRGKNPDEAKEEYEEVKHHSLPKKNVNVIDLVEHRRQVYKRSGMNTPKLLGVFILAVFLSDIASAFISHNPWGQSPHIFVGMVIYNFFFIISSETGYILWKEVNK
jgi:hypothetical protein